MLRITNLQETVNFNIGSITSVDVENMYSNSGKKAPNQFNLFLYGSEGNFRLFKSYETIIAVRCNGVTYLDSKWCYSPTTLRYLKQWLGTQASKAEIVERIDNGTYKLVDLN